MIRVNREHTPAMSVSVAAARLAPLPNPLTPLIGRERDVARVADLIRDPGVPLVTLTGPGGVGKTRLAIAAAASVVDDFGGGVAFVNLAPITNPDLVLDTIAGAIGLRDLGTEPLRDRLGDVLADRRLLMVLDNFEQVVTAGPRVRDLLAACPGVTFLITSRISLRLSGEREVSVAPLPVSPAAPAGTATGSDAVRLFVERAQAIRPEFRLTSETLPAVTDIVNRVDGLPLAIELAAARIKALPPPALLHRLDQRLPLLSGGARDLPLRQQTMRDTIGWSYDLLPPAEQGFFRQLAVFVGGFTLEAAEAVNALVADAAGGQPSPAVLDAVDEVTALIDHSLLRQYPESGGEPRYLMLETVREFGLERLEAGGEAEEHAVRGAHAAWCLALAEDAVPALWSTGRGEWLDRLDRERDNLRAALHWALGRAEFETATRLGAALWRFWEHRGYLSIGRSHLASILSQPSGVVSLAARSGALTGAGVLAAAQGDYDQATRLGEEALAGWRQLGDRRGIGRTLLCLAAVARYRDDYAGAWALGQDSLAAYRAINDRWGIGHVLTHLGMVAWVQGDHPAGAAYYDEALTHFRDVGDDSGIFEVLLEQGKGACDAGDLARATALFEACLALAAAMGDGLARGAVLTELGVVARLRGDYGRATGLFTEANGLAQENGDRRQAAYIAEHLGEVELATGDIGTAAARFAEALALFLSIGNRVGIAQGLQSVARCAAIRGRSPDAVRFLGTSAALFTAVGAAPPPDRDPTADAAALKPTMPAAEFAQAWETGQTMSPADAAAGALAAAAGLAAEEAAAGPPAPAPAAPFGLTRREREVLALVASGMTDPEIAGALSVGRRTAESHVSAILAKLGVENRAAAAALAVRHGLA